MVICFTPDDNVRNSIPSIVIEGNLVETVEYAKVLGVTLTNDLTWNRHVECIVKKKGCQKSAYIISVKESRHYSIISGHSLYVWSEPSVRRISTSVSVCVGMCSVVAIQADP